MVSFDVVSLYTKVSVEEAIKIISNITNDETTNMVRICLKSTCFTFQDKFYEKMDGVVMGSPLSPVVVNIYMEHFENKSIDSWPLKPRNWKRFVDDTNVIWQHGRENLECFLNHLNSQ